MRHCSLRISHLKHARCQSPSHQAPLCHSWVALLIQAASASQPDRGHQCPAGDGSSNLVTERMEVLTLAKLCMND